MKMVLNIILSVFVCIQSLGFNVSSLTQLDKLWSHYQEHKTEYGDGIITFLDLHYGGQQQDHQDEHPEHQDLPVQQNPNVQHTFFINNNTSLDVSFVYLSKSIKHNFGYSEIFKSLLETDILQPPKTLT